MKDITEFFKNNQWLVNIIMSLVVIVISVIIYSIIDNFITKKIKKGSKIIDGKKYVTFIKMIKNISKYLLIVIDVFLILQIFGVNVSSVLASIGVISVVIGFAIQDSLKDIIKGFDILSDNYYQVGDVIRYDTNLGKVLSIGLKTTKIEDITTMNIVSISNRNIEKVEVESHMINIDVPLPYELKLKDAEEAIDEIIKKIVENSKVEKAEYRSVSELDDSCIKYQIKVYCSPALKPQIRRDSLRCVLEALEEKGIAVPYQQIDIHTKD